MPKDLLAVLTFRGDREVMEAVEVPVGGVFEGDLALGVGQPANGVVGPPRVDLT